MTRVPLASHDPSMRPVARRGEIPTPSGGRRSLTLLMLASLLAMLAISPSSAAETGYEPANSQLAPVTLTPDILVDGVTAPTQLTMTLHEGSWPSALNVLIDEYGITVPGAIDESQTQVSGDQLQFTLEPGLPEGLYEARVVDLTGAVAEDVAIAPFVVGEGTEFLISGDITDSSAEPLDGICVEAQLFVDETWYWDEVESMGGSYEIRFLVPGSSTTVDLESLSFRDCARWDPSADDLYVAGSGEGSVRDLVLEAGETLVVDRTMYLGASVDITVLDPGGAELEDCYRGFGPLPPGERTFQVRFCFEDGVRYTSPWVGDTRNPEAAEVIDVQEGQTYERTVMVEPVGTITGQVSDAETGGEPTSCVGVYERVDGVRSYASFRISPGSEGQFELFVAPGEVTVEFAPCITNDWSTGEPVEIQLPFPYQVQFYDDRPTVDQADPVPVQSGETTTGIDAALRSSDALFSDVSSDHPFHDEIAWLVDEGITEGWPDNTFRPTAAVTRQAVAAFLYRYAVE